MISRNNYKTVLVVLVLVCAIASGCTHDEIVVPVKHNSAICDTLHIKYSTCVQPIFKNECYQCHSDSASQNGNIAFDIENFASLKFYLNNYYHNDSIYGSKFMSVIGYRLGVVHMPPTAEIPLNEVGIIRQWIDSGAIAN